MGGQVFDISIIPLPCFYVQPDGSNPLDEPTQRGNTIVYTCITLHLNTVKGLSDGCSCAPGDNTN